MNGILSAIGTESSADRLGCRRLSSKCVGGTNAGPPLLNGAGSDKFHANNDITADELGQGREEGLVAMLSVELSGGRGGEAGHLHFVEYKAT